MAVVYNRVSLKQPSLSIIDVAIVTVTTSHHLNEEEPHGSPSRSSLSGPQPTAGRLPWPSKAFLNLSYRNSGMKVTFYLSAPHLHKRFQNPISEGPRQLEG